MDVHPLLDRPRIIRLLCACALPCAIWILARIAGPPLATTAQGPEPHTQPSLAYAGSIGGEIYATAFYETQDGQVYACVGEGYGLTILNVQNPKNPTRVARLLLEEPVKDIHIVGTYAYVADTDGLKVVDMSAPTSPKTIGQYTAPVNANGVYVDGQYAYIADGAEGATCGRGCYLHIVDISNPASLLTEPDTKKVSFLESVYDVYVHEGYAYVANGSRGIQIVDIGNPTAPKEKTTYDTAGSATSIQIVGTTGYIADGSGGMEMVDISNPEAPTRISTYDEIVTANHVGIDAEKSLAYISAGSEGVKIVNISTPLSPTLESTYATNGATSHVTLANGHAYVASDKDGLDIVDIRPVPLNPPSLVGRYSPPRTVNDIYAVDQYAYVAAGEEGLRVIDTNDPAMPNALARYDTSGLATAVYVEGDYAYVADGDAGMQIINISTPFFPTFTGNYKPEVQIRDVYVEESYAYVAAWNNAGLHVVDIQNLETPMNKKSVPTGKATSVYVAGTYAYVATAENGLQIVDISTPTEANIVGTFGNPLGGGASFEDVFVVGDYAYIAAAEAGLHIVDISTPTAPTQKNTYKPTDAKVMSIYVVGDYAFVADANNGLLVLDVSDPAAPTLMPDNSYDTPGQANTVYVTRGAPNDVAYLADGVGGMHIVHLDADETPKPTPTPPPDIPDCASAPTISTDGTEQQYAFEVKDDVDWVRFDAVAGQTYLIEAYATENSPADVVLELRPSCQDMRQVPTDLAFSRGVKLNFVAPSNGYFYLKIENNNDNYGDSVTYTIVVRNLSSNNTGALILVAGRLKNNDKLQPNIHDVTGKVYTVFKSHGYNDEHIYYLSTDNNLDGVDNGQATKAKLKEAITEWAPKYVDSKHPLTLYLMDHGSEEHGFYLDEITDQQRVSPSELAKWLEEIPSDVPINIIVEACHSGVFVEELAKEGRVIITSTKPELIAYASQDGATFSDHFLATLDGHSSLYKAFQDGREAVKIHDKDSPGPQKPLIEDNGNGTPNDPEDGLVAQKRGFGADESLTERTFGEGTNNVLPDQFIWPPSITDIQKPCIIEDEQGTITAYVSDDTGVEWVWATMYKPSYIPPTPETENEMVSESGLPTLPLTCQKEDEFTSKCTLTYAQFDEEGTYRFVIHAKDTDDLEALPKVIEVVNPTLPCTETPTDTPTIETITPPTDTPTIETITPPTDTPTPPSGLQVYLPLVRR